MGRSVSTYLWLHRVAALQMRKTRFVPGLQFSDPHPVLRWRTVWLIFSPNAKGTRGLRHRHENEALRQTSCWSVTLLPTSVPSHDTAWTGLTLWVDGASSVPWETDELVAGGTGHFWRSDKQLRGQRLCCGKVWLGASWGQTVEGLLVFTAARGLLQGRESYSLHMAIRRYYFYYLNSVLS